MYATATRAHDATWLLQGERVLNDAIVRKERAKKRKHTKQREPRTMLTLIPNTPGEEAAAERVVRKAASQLGLDTAARDELLQALGLREPAGRDPLPRGPLGLQHKAIGTCADCGRLVHLRRDGMVIAHTRSKHAPPGTPHCPGTHMQPRQEATP